MLSYIARRSFFLVVTFFGIVTLVFFVSHLIPGDPAIVIAGPKATPEVIEHIRQQYGLDKPVVVQYIIYVKSLLRGDLGISIYTRRPVSVEIAERFPATFELTFFSMILAAVLGIVIGIICAARPNTLIDSLFRIVTIGGICIPDFWLAILLQLTFFYLLGILPAQGRISGTLPEHVTGLYLIDSLLEGDLIKFIDSIRHIILPAFALSLGYLAQIARMTRGSMLEVLHELYIMKARAIGLKESAVLFKHAFRNAFVPVLTAIGMYAGLALGGAVVIESVFSWRGMGLLMYKGIINCDFNAIMGVTIVFALSYLVLNFIVDVLYPIVNPEIKF